MRKEDRYDGLIRWYAEQNKLEWLKIKAQIKQESAFDPRAVSSVGARGLGQFMPATWDEWGHEADVFDSEANISAMCRYMRWQLDRFANDWLKALAAYNWGIGNVQKAVGRLGAKWQDALPQETRDYLANIQRNYDAYRAEPIKEAA